MQPPRVLPAGHRVAVFDFEHTLFAMRKFLRECLFRALEPLGMNAKRFATLYRACATSYHERLLPHGLLKRLASECDVSEFRIELAVAVQLFAPAAQHYLSRHIGQLVARARLSHDRLVLLCEGSEPYKTTWLRRMGIYSLFHPDEVILGTSKRVALHQHLGPVSQVTMITSYQRDVRDLAAFLNKRGVAVVPIIVRHDKLDRAIELL